MAEIDALPPGVRTSADVVMLWNGQWLDEGVPPPGVIAGALRGVIGRTIAGAPANCRDAKTTGPQFIPIHEEGKTVVIVVGSGTWRWRDLIKPPLACGTGSPAGCETTTEMLQDNNQS